MRDKPPCVLRWSSRNRSWNVTACSSSELAVTRSVRGPRGSEVVLTVERDGEELDIPITRDTVVTDDVRSASSSRLCKRCGFDGEEVRGGGYIGGDLVRHIPH